MCCGSCRCDDIKSTQTAKGLHIPAVPGAEAGSKKRPELHWVVHSLVSPLDAEALENLADEDSTEKDILM